MKRPSYREAILWLVYNDDTEWVDNDPEDGRGTPSVTAALIADLFATDTERVRRDVSRMLRKEGR